MAVNRGDHIPYIICKAKEGESTENPALRAHHPKEIEASNGELEVDIEWYLGKQLLPPLARICDPIEGTSHSILAEQLGLDPSKYKDAGINLDNLNDVDFTPQSMLDDR